MSRLSSMSKKPKPQAGWVLTFADDFNSFNSATRTGPWKTRYEWGPNTTINNELQYYVDTQDPANPLPSVNPFSVANSILTIRADKHTAPNNKQYTSGAITTHDYFSQKYGYFEMRAKLPPGNGVWPAFWMMTMSGVWPPELDIMEAIGQQPTTLYTTSHSATTSPTDSHCYPQVANMQTAFHTYGFKWDAYTMIWYFDDSQVCQFPTRSDQNQLFYVLLNLAIGSGGWTGTPDATNVWPADYQIDYVRVWQQSSQNPPACVGPDCLADPPLPLPILSASNLALTRPVVASSIESASYPERYAVDGDMTTRWSSVAGVDPGWIYVDLGTTRTISRVIIFWEWAYATAYQIQVSNDASAWTTIYTTSTGDGATDDVAVSGTGRYVRIYGTTRATQYGYSIYELQIYGA